MCFSINKNQALLKENVVNKMEGKLIEIRHEVSVQASEITSKVGIPETLGPLGPIMLIKGLKSYQLSCQERVE